MEAAGGRGGVGLESVKVCETGLVFSSRYLLRPKSFVKVERYGLGKIQSF